MIDLDELLQYGLSRIGDRARPADLSAGIAKTARSIRHRRVIAITAATLVLLVLALPPIAHVLGRSEIQRKREVPAQGPTPTPSEGMPSIGHAPWVSAAQVANRTFVLDEWQVDPDGEPVLCDAPAAFLADNGTPIDGGAYRTGPNSTAESIKVAYVVTRFDSVAAALNAYQRLDIRMDNCGSRGSSGKALTTDSLWRLTGWEPAGLRQREERISRAACTTCVVEDQQSTMIMLWDRYVTIASWAQYAINIDDPSALIPPTPGVGPGAVAFAIEIMSGIAVHEMADPASSSLTTSDTLGPDGYGPIKLGMTLTEALATGQITEFDSRRQTSPCASSPLPSDDPFSSHNPPQVYISPTAGVVQILADPETTRTPEGISARSTVSEFKTAYPGYEEGEYAITAPVPGRPDYSYRIRVSNEPDPQVLGLELYIPGVACFD